MTSPPSDEPPRPQFASAGQRAIGAIDERLQLFDQHLAVGIGLAAAEAFVLDRRVFIDAMLAGVVDADDDQRLDLAGEGELVRGLAHSPVVAFAERRLRIEEVLAILHVENGEAPVGVLIVHGRQINDEVVLLVLDLRRELGVKAEARLQVVGGCELEILRSGALALVGIENRGRFHVE